MLAVSWQASLSLSAVAAAEDVRSAARAARTASGAKSAAELAALKAHETLNRENFSNASALKAAQVVRILTRPNDGYFSKIISTNFLQLNIQSVLKCHNRTLFTLL